METYTLEKDKIKKTTVTEEFFDSKVANDRLSEIDSLIDGYKKEKPSEAELIELGRDVYLNNKVTVIAELKYEKERLNNKLQEWQA